MSPISFTTAGNKQCQYLALTPSVLLLLAAAGVTELFLVGRIARMNKEFVLKMRISW